MTNHQNRSKQQQAKHTPQAEWLAGVLAKLPADDHARVLALVLAQNRLNAELLAALKEGEKAIAAGAYDDKILAIVRATIAKAEER